MGKLNFLNWTSLGGFQTEIGWGRDRLLPNVIFDINSVLEWLLWNSSCQIWFGNGQNAARAQRVCRRPVIPSTWCLSALFMTDAVFSFQGRPGEPAPGLYLQPLQNPAMVAVSLHLRSHPSRCQHHPESSTFPTCQWTETTTAASADIDSETSRLIEKEPSHSTASPLGSGSSRPLQSKNWFKDLQAWPS